MIKPINVDRILLNVSHYGVFQFTVDKLAHLDIRRQICEQHLEGYSLTVNPLFWHLFDKDDNIETFVVNISPDGKVDKWFPEYELSKEYGDVTVFSETLEVVKKLRKVQIAKENIDE